MSKKRKKEVVPYKGANTDVTSEITIVEHLAAEDILVFLVKNTLGERAGVLVNNKKESILGRDIRDSILVIK